MNKAIERAGQAVGGLTKLADAMGVSLQAVCQWRDKQVPIERCPAIEALTGKKVRRWDLRPNDWHLIWPELRSLKSAPKVEA